MKEACPDRIEQLSAYADGELDAASAQRIEEHVATCSACRVALHEWRAAGATLAALEPLRSDVEWERLAQRVEAAIDADESAGAEANVAVAAGARRPARRWLWGGSGALVAAALVLMFWPWVSQQTTDTPPSFPSAGTAERVDDTVAERSDAPTTQNPATRPAETPGAQTQETSAAPSPDVSQTPLPDVHRGADAEAPAASRAEARVKDVRRVAVVPEAGEGLASRPDQDASAEKREFASAAPAPMNAESAERSAPAESEEATGAALGEPLFVRGGRSESIDSLLAETDRALAVVPSADEAASRSMKSLQKQPIALRSNDSDSGVKVTIAPSEHDTLHRLVSEWEHFYVVSQDDDAREGALATLVRLRDRLVQLDAENECVAASLAIAAWRRDGADDDEAHAAAEAIERICNSR